MRLSIDPRFKVLLLATAVVLALAAGIMAWAWPVSAQDGETESDTNTVTIEVEVEQPMRFTQVSAGLGHSCGLRPDGSVACWTFSSLANSSRGVPEDETFTFIDSGRWSPCGLKADGSVICWGDDLSSPHEDPRAPEGGYGPFEKLAVSYAHGCGIKSDGTAQCWGWGRFGGRNVPAGATFQKLSLGAYHTCGLRTDGTLSCWGEPPPDRWNTWDHHRHGQGSPPSGTYVDVEAAGWYACALDAEGHATCWGLNDKGQSSPPADETFQPGSLALGYDGGCGLRPDDTIACWGQGGVTWAPSGTFQSIDAQYHHACGIRTDGEAICWGASTPIPTETVTVEVEVSTPSIPQNLTATANHKSATLTWDAPAEDEYITGYQVLRRQPPGERELQVYVADTGSGTNEWTDTNVEPTTPYVYRVKAINAAGISEQSNFVRPETAPIPPPPAAPANLTNTTKDVSITLNWEAPAGDIEVTGYQILRNSPPDETLQVYVADTGSTATKYVDTNVELDTTYVYVVKAIGDGGVGDQSNSVRTTTPIMYLPAAPTNIWATTTPTTITVTWNAPDDDSVTGYRIYRGEEAGPNPTVMTTYVADTGSTATVFLDTNVRHVNGRSNVYRYQVSALNAGGASKPTESFGLGLARRGEWRLAPPRNLTATATRNSVALDWDAPDDYDYTLYYQVHRRLASETDFQVVTAHTGGRNAPAETATSYVDNSVEPETTYVYRVVNVNGNISGDFSNQVSVLTVDPPAAPTNLSSTATHDSVTLTWDAPADGQYITGYQILRRQPPGEETLQVYVADTGSSATEWTDTNVEASTAYVYRVKAINAAGVGAQSNFTRPETLPIPPLAAPGNLSATATHDAVTLTWEASDDDRVTGYRIQRDGQVIVADTGSTDTGYVDSAVSADTAYEYGVSALGSDSSVSDTVSVSITTTAPPPSGDRPSQAPQNVRASSSSGSVTLTWDAPDDDSITGYQIIRRIPIGPNQNDWSVIVDDTDTTATTYVDSNVETGTRYLYRVKAVNEGGVGPQSNTARVNVR